MAATEAITSYDGIFKGMYDANLRSLFVKFKGQIAEGKWAAGKETLSQAISEAYDKPNDLKTLKLIESEVARYDKYHIRGGEPALEANWDEIKNRPIARLDESLFELPQSIFFLNVAVPGYPSPVRLVGRKLLSDLWIKDKIPEIHCSFISADMILGLYVDQRVTESKVVVHYYPFENAEKLLLMKNVVDSEGKSAELIFPFSLLRESSRKELCSPPEGWIVDDAFDVMLGCGEERIREYTIYFMKSVNTTTATLYDPACSTGVYLSTLKKAFPNSFTIGQDLSEQMVGFSRQRVDEVHCGNAMEPKIKAGTADFVYIRFLNSEVVTSAEAEDLMLAVLPTVKKSGYFIVFGHTPVLLSSANFQALDGFRLVQSVGVARDKSGIFQYYILQRV